MSALLKGGDYQLGADAIQMMTIKVIKGQEFPSVECMLAPPGGDEKEAAQGAKRATHSLVVTVSGAANLGGCCRHRGLLQLYSLN